MDPSSGAGNGANGTWPSNNAMSLPMRPRLPTVDDALQFSPLCSITPFDPGTSFHFGPAAHHRAVQLWEGVPAECAQLLRTTL